MGDYRSGSEDERGAAVGGKRCTGCGNVKPLEAFSLNRRNKTDGRQPKCKACNKQYASIHKKRIEDYTAAYKKKNRKLLAQKQRQYRQRNPEKHSEWRLANKEHRDRYMKAYREGRRNELTKQWLEYREQRKENDISFKISESLRSRLNTAIKRKYRSGSAVRDLGCSIKQLASHLEAQFADGMCWDNWGEVWQIDHIFPLSAADLSDRAELLAVCNWRNLQPLTVADNTRKQDTVTAAARRLFKKLVAEMRQVVEEETAA